MANKEKDIKTKQEEEKLSSSDDKIRLKAEISKLQTERSELVGQIGKIKVQIGKLESDQTMYEGMLSRAENYKKDLEKDYAKLSQDEKSIFNKIKTEQSIKDKIKEEIDEIKEKQASIQTKIKGLETMREAADAARQNLTAWDKKHEFSFGNLRDAIFQGAELYMDAFGGRGMLRAVGGGITKKAAGTIAKGGLIVHEAHRAVHLAQQLMQNEDGTPKMMSKETYDTITKRIEKEIEEAKHDYKDSEGKLLQYKAQKDQNEITKQIEESNDLKESIKSKRLFRIDEFQKIVDELDKKRKEVLDVDKLYQDKNDLTEELDRKNVEIDARKEELKQKSPNYAKAQERIKQKKYSKFFQPITN
ncbi:hypothetical protein [Poinsettia branch-inducing phytoplasma]|uniref:hypothetical protein n=1 Tax=Poinsettia branch-inducing phytoplasma TaxID=138647 RepID=UPI00037A069E|nr:hypothetical protein [Poinsettia branch-inducing phytoplasma]